LLLYKQISLEFGEAQFFCTHRVIEYQCWMKASNGIILRVYSYLGESGKNIEIEGEPTEVEQPLNLVNTLSSHAEGENYFEREDLTWPDEDLVMKIAGNWSIDPTQLDKRADISRG
jgi:hypothetical protein